MELHDKEDSSDLEILPEARIFDMCIDDIFKAESAAHEAYFNRINEETTEEAKEENKDSDLISTLEKELKKKTKGKRTKRKIPVDVPKKTVKTRSSRRKKKESSASEEEEEEEEMEDREEHIEEEKVEPESPNIKLPSVALKRIKELRLRNDREKMRVEEENRRALFSEESDDRSVYIPVTPEKIQEINLRIKYISKVSRLKVLVNEKFATIIVKVAELFQLKAAEILLCVEDENIELTDTPKSLNLNYCSVIDCLPYKPSVAAENDPNKLLVQIQSSDSRKKVDIYVHKLEPLAAMMQQYAEMKNLPVEHLCFEFDGEKICDTETPDDLDMESGSCVDVRMVKPSLQTIPKKVSPQVIHLSDSDDDFFSIGADVEFVD